MISEMPSEPLKEYPTARHAPAAPERVCSSPKQRQRYEALVQRLHARYAPVSFPELNIVNEIVLATWLMHHWEMDLVERRRQFRAMTKEVAPGEAPSEEAERMRQASEHARWHAVKQRLYIQRRAEKLYEMRREYEGFLSEAGCDIEDARADFLSRLEEPSMESKLAA